MKKPLVILVISLTLGTGILLQAAISHFEEQPKDIKSYIISYAIGDPDFFKAAVKAYNLTKVNREFRDLAIQELAQRLKKAPDEARNRLLEFIEKYRGGKEYPVPFLLEVFKKADAGLLNKVIKSGQTPLKMAARKKNFPQLVQAFIDAGADVNLVNEGSTPIISAIASKSPEMVKVLIDNKADVNLPKRELGTVTPLDFARRINSDAQIIDLLLDAGAKE